MATLAREWIEAGIEKGLLSSIRTGLKTRFGTEGEQFMDDIADLHDPAKLQQIVSVLFEASTLTEFRSRCRALLANDTPANGTHFN